MAILEALERRLQQVESRLCRQRRLTAALATLALVGLLAALRPPDPEVLRAHRLEIVDDQGQVVGGFGFGALEALGVRQDGSHLGWILRDPATRASAYTLLTESDAPTGDPASLEKVPTTVMSLTAGEGVALFNASDQAVNAELLLHEERGVGLYAQRGSSELSLLAPSASVSERYGVDVLRLSQSTGGPTIQGYDEIGKPTIDIK